MDERGAVGHRAYALPTAVLAGIAVVSLLAAVTLGVLVVRGTPDADDSAPADAPTTRVPSSPDEPSGRQSESPEDPEPTSEDEPAEEPTTEESPDRGAVAVSVLNASTVNGLAQRVSGQVEQAGWSVGAVGNWQGAVAENTVHFPPGRRAEAQVLADDLAVGAVAPSVAGMNAERLTLVLVGPP